MAVFSTIIAAIGIAASVAGTAIAFKSSQQQAKAQKQMIAAQQRAEQQRELQMNLDATRKKREVIRQAQVARANALSTGAAQGAGESSSLEGAFGGISGQSGVNMLGISQNQEIGGKIFAANRDVGAAQGKMADAQSFGAMGSGLSSLGGALVKNSDTIGKIGTYFGGGK